MAAVKCLFARGAISCLSFTSCRNVTAVTKCINQFKTPLSITVRNFSVSRFYLQEKKFSKDHEWISVDDAQIGKVGLTNYAQNALGDVVYVSLPDVGTEVSSGDECGSVESVKTVSDIYSPVAGEVTEVNTALDDDPTLINTSCYDDGWVYKLKLSDPEELNSLMSEFEYDEFLKSSEEDH